MAGVLMRVLTAMATIHVEIILTVKTMILLLHLMVSIGPYDSNIPPAKHHSNEWRFACPLLASYLVQFL